MAASTPSTCFRSDSESIHSHTRAHASSRVGAAIINWFAFGPNHLLYGASRSQALGSRSAQITLLYGASRSQAVVTLAAQLMEKFVIQGGTPLTGEIVAAGNKNAALPILAACLLTDEELILSNVPRIRDTESQVA